MDAQAVEQAKERLRKADKALYALKTATCYEEAEEAWSDFLLAASTIYSKLEQGAKQAKGKSAPWFGRKKKERKDDPLLRFLHHARNSDEHGIKRVAARGGNARGMNGKPLMFNEYEECIMEYRDSVTGELKTTPAILHGPSLQMVRVHDDRFGDYCDPPIQHLGKTIEVEDNSLIGVASLGFTFLTNLVAEAETLVPR
ncbi:hypothetical protein LMTR3_15200 [Bradyrhizobium sp. LMTR 3]|nr:hypothetical protein LMTR3_15200 [Bradyrhizobium sp. LMTR 3]